MGCRSLEDMIYWEIKYGGDARMNIGYACLTFSVPGTKFRVLRKKDVTEDRLREVIADNLDALERIIDYNGLHGIRLFRITSDLIPFGSSPINSLDWGTTFVDRWKGIGDKIRRLGIRVSMHPGQYTVLNSPDSQIVANAVADLEYHARVLDLLETDPSSKIILHVGGTYGNRKEAIGRFSRRFRELPGSVQRRLIIENDDRSYTIGEVLDLAKELGIPAVYDNLHDEINPTDPSVPPSEWIRRAASTWKPADGRQKIHYSQQAPGKPRGSHSDTILIDSFLDFVGEIADADIMLEVKDKDRSAIKCLNCLRPDREIKHLEGEWARYKYLVLEHDPKTYQDIRILLKDKTLYPVLAFYRAVEKALSAPVLPGHAQNALEHVAGYFSSKLPEKERASLQKSIEKARNGAVSIGSIKKRLLSMAEHFGEKYLLNTYYFGEDNALPQEDKE